MSKALSQKEVDHQLAVGSMDKGNAFVEHIKRMLTPVPWPSIKELHKPYPNLKDWMQQVDEKLGEVIEQFNIFFTDEEINTADGYIYIEFTVNTFSCEDWSAVMVGEDIDKIEQIYEYLQIISPLMVAFYNPISAKNITMDNDT